MGIKTFKHFVCVYVFLKSVLFQARVIMESITSNLLTHSVEHSKSCRAQEKLRGDHPLAHGK